MNPDSNKLIRGRGAGINPPNRFDRIEIVPDPEGAPEGFPAPQTRFYRDDSSSLIVFNDSPDVGFDAGINPYRGCEHGCAYCYARPTHEYLGFSAGLDFESRIMVKTRAPEILRAELARRSWRPQTVAMSGVTDCYQPAERHFRLTRRCLEVFAEFRNPVAIITKNHLVTRDIDILRELSRFHAAGVFISVTTLDAELAGKLEPRASSPAHRLEAIERLAAAGVPVGVMVAPVLPGLTDHEIPAILAAAAKAGCSQAGFTLLRLPYAVKDIFVEWLRTHYPSKAERVLSRIRSVRGGKINESAFGSRMRGEGIFAEQVRGLFTVAARREGLNRDRMELSAAAFRRPGSSEQLELFDNRHGEQ